MIKLFAKLCEVPGILLGDSADYEQSDVEYGQLLQLDCLAPSYVKIPPSKSFLDSVVIQVESRSFVMYHEVDVPKIMFNPISYEELILNTGADEHDALSSEEIKMQSGW